ncbi:MAG TPA: sugar transporter [Marinilabiliales bacterium]|nr:MAG: hypothetical protein A2W95_00940 [Bacteroidetes bacterium GWA2_40_14]OFX74039.1 MAG: hypothetical protein A2W96_12055 [Bacteroidetes bacterium GWD2_40_43]OFX93126.1 MAG: hypothetical protein A2W97_06015 [Bacteroidetes bacterium GWE2_40_63]OFY21496.1 MAG: hypothetical protein A2W88_10015 [Bacteroidetes bacterium GWF2_40_13]OFZ24151.1 MAG: hypothetical protein A2437_17150 [Bacteroidetes bacterium RIFOXYC2_FULL_40_12]HAM98110.1 sugar transporter [Marinilabiliales bacterium]
MNSKKLTTIVIVLVSLAFMGCARYKNVLYFQDKIYANDTLSIGIQQADPQATVVYPGDNLFLSISGDASGQTDQFNKQATTTGNFSEISLYMHGYLIDDQGNIELPVLGKIQVNGLTLYQVQQLIQQKMDEYFTGSIVEVRLLNFEVTVLGEVVRPGTYPIYKKNVTILEVLAKAGDIGDFGDARHVLIVRKGPFGSTTLDLNLTSTGVFQNPGFWVAPGDVIYVKPLRAKMVSINTPAISVVLSGLTTLLLLITYTKM